MRLTSFIVAFVGASVIVSAQGRGQGVPDNGGPLVLEIAGRQYLSADRMGSSAGDSGTDRLEGYVWTSTGLCGMSASTTEPATVPGVGWHFVGRVLSNDDGQMRVSVEWQRMWDRNTRTPGGSSGSQTISLRSGERIQLDRVLPFGQAGCNASEARLEAAVVARPVYRVGVMDPATGRVGMAGGRGGGRGSAMGQGQQGQQGQPTQQGQLGQQTQQGQRGQQVQQVQQGRGGRASADPNAVANAQAAAVAAQGAATATSARGTSVGMGRGRGGAASTNAADPAAAATASASNAQGGRGGRASSNFTVFERPANPGSQEQRKPMSFLALAKPHEAELWLVHRTPDGTEHVQQQMVRFAGSEVPFVFPSVQVATSKGTVTLEITGKLQSFVGDQAPTSGRGSSFVALRLNNFNEPAATQHIVVAISRRARGNTPALLDNTGGSVMVIDVPKPDDVVSFEFPALQKAAEDLLKGHQFSLRLQIK